MVAATGNAPVYSALQADANLSQLSSLLKIVVFGGCTWKLHTDVLLTSMRKNGLWSAFHPLVLRGSLTLLNLTMLQTNTLLHWQLQLNVAFCELLGCYGHPSS